VWTLGEDVFKMLEILPKWFVRILSKLHDVFRNERSSIDRAKFVQENFEEIIPGRD